MVIHRLPVKAERGVSFREFQAELTEVGRIRIGVFNPDKGNRGAPEKIESFRFTSQQEPTIRKVAEKYGGIAEEYQPQGSRRTEWQVITPAKVLPVYIEPQIVDPWLEAWAGGPSSSKCVRRCDGITETKQDIPCPCAAGQFAEKDMCKPVARVKLLLAEVPGIGLWRLESHGTKFVEEIAGMAPYIAVLRKRAPGLLYLEERRAQPWVNGRQIITTVYVPHLSISVATPEQFAIGGDVLTQALEAGTANALDTAERPALTSGTGPGSDVGEQMAIGSGVGAGTPSAADADQGLEMIAKAKGRTVAEVRATILRDIEAQTTTGTLDALKDKLKSRGVRDEQIKQAWRARFDAIEAAAKIGGSAPGTTSVTMRSEDLRSIGNAEHQQALRTVQEARAEAQAHVRQVLDGGGVEDAVLVEPDFQVGDTVTVGGVEFTRIGNDPFGPGGSTIPPSAGPESVDWETGYNAVCIQAGHLGWTTAQTNAVIKRACGVDTVGKADGGAMRDLARAIQTGQVAL
jgi:hypothetical protein